MATRSHPYIINNVDVTIHTNILYIFSSIETMMCPRNENVWTQHISADIFCHVARKNMSTRNKNSCSV